MRTAIAAHFGLANFPVAYCGLKIITSLALRFPDFQRQYLEQLRKKLLIAVKAGDKVRLI
ncbi:hypothetical protein BAZMOX_345802_0 [methanotrophic endosymbiont of Bathymodiolus azoricus (Menez Gwen)]|nr:hypothetical protein BAZMOX_345802_0 [methanotrophic endosymbiont of Bathymodiolus azoricus (Menez Gwen)]